MIYVNQYLYDKSVETKTVMIYSFHNLYISLFSSRSCEIVRMCGGSFLSMLMLEIFGIIIRCVPLALKELVSNILQFQFSLQRSLIKKSA